MYDRELKEVYQRRASNMQRKGEIEKAMQKAFLRAQENQEFYMKAQREYLELDDDIEADNERIRDISKRLRNHDDALPDLLLERLKNYDDTPSTTDSPAPVGAILEMVNLAQQQFPHEWRDLDSDTSLTL